MGLPHSPILRAWSMYLYSIARRCIPLLIARRCIPLLLVRRRRPKLRDLLVPTANATSAFSCSDLALCVAPRAANSHFAQVSKRDREPLTERPRRAVMDEDGLEVELPGLFIGKSATTSTGRSIVWGLLVRPVVKRRP